MGRWYAEPPTGAVQQIYAVGDEPSGTSRHGTRPEGSLLPRDGHARFHRGQSTGSRRLFVRCSPPSGPVTIFVSRWVGMEYEFQRFSVPRTITRSAVTRMLTDHAEYGGWELARLRLYPDGSRKVELRRKIIRVRPPLIREFRPLV